MNELISIYDQLPTEGKEVIVTTAHGQFVEALRKGDTWINSRSDYVITAEITHWMNKPKIPNSEFPKLKKLCEELAVYYSTCDSIEFGYESDNGVKIVISKRRITANGRFND